MYQKIFNKIGLGTVQFGLNYGISNKKGKVPLKDIKKILNLAKTSKIMTLDTASTYGLSEKILGNCGINDWSVVTKIPAVPEKITKVDSWILNEVSQSLKRLKIKKLDSLLLHHPNQLLGDQGSWIYESLKNLKLNNYVNKIGVSVYSPEELDLIFKKYTLDIVQLPLNIIDRRFSTSGWISRLNNNNVEIHTRSAFLQGLLLMKAADRPVFFNKWSSVWKEWDKWLIEKNISPLKACIDFVLSQNEISKVIVGVDSFKQLKQIINIIDESFVQPSAKLECDDKHLINPTFWPK